MALGLDERVQRLPAEIQSLIYNHFCVDLDDNEFCFRIFKQPDHVLCSACLPKKVEPQIDRSYGSICRFACRYQQYRLRGGRKAGAHPLSSWTNDEEEAFMKYFRSISRAKRTRHWTNFGSNECVTLWIYLMTGQTRNRKQVSSHVQVLKGLCHPESDYSNKCRSCVVRQLHDHVRECLRELGESVSPETCEVKLAPWAISRVSESIERFVAGFTHVIGDLAAASDKTDYERGVADQLTKKTVERIQKNTSELIEGVANVTIEPWAESEDQDYDDEWDPDDFRTRLSHCVSRLQKVVETLTIEKPSQRSVSTSHDLSPPTVCETVRSISPALDQMLRVGADPRNRIIIERCVNKRIGAENGRDPKHCDDGENSLLEQQAPWMSAKVDRRLNPHLWLEFDDLEALKVFTERTTKQIQKSVTHIELEYDPFDEGLTVDAVIGIVNTKFPSLRTFCTSILPVRRLKDQHWRPLAALPAHQRYTEQEVAYFKALENLSAHVCLLFRWKSDADWFLHKYPWSGKWRRPVYRQGDEGFGEWIFDRGF